MHPHSALDVTGTRGAEDVSANEHGAGREFGSFSGPGQGEDELGFCACSR